MKKRKPTTIDLFSGCGGFSYGFQNAGFDVILGVDNDPIALKTFEANHKDSRSLLLDLSEQKSVNKIDKEVGRQRVDILIAGPPCQGFSLTGTRDDQDKRNKLFYSVFELAKKRNPKVILIENVPGLATLYGGRAKDEILRMCDQIGYRCSYKVLYAPDYGIPQLRKRIFFVATKNGLKHFNFPKTKKSPCISCQEAIGDLPPLKDLNWKDEMAYRAKAKTSYQRSMRRGSKKIYNHIGTRHTQLVIDVIAQVPEGGNYKQLPRGVGTSRTFNEAWTRYHSKKPSKTIDTGHRNHFHYKWNRVPTVRENARLQSFPDKFIFYGNKTEQYKQVGNAVPPLLGKVLGHQIKKML